MIREILGKSISNKFFGLSKQDKEKEEQRKNTLLGVASLKIIVKNMFVLPRMGRDLKIVAKGFGKFLKNETGEDPAKESLLSRLAPIKDAFMVVKVKEPKEKREKKEKKRRSLLEIVFGPLITAATLLFTVFIFNKDLVLQVLEMYGGVEGIIGSALDSGVETEGVKEEKRKALEEDPYANAVETIKTLDEDISLLKNRITALKQYLIEKKEYEQEKAKGTVQREAPKPPPAITPTKRVSDKSVFATKEPAPTARPLGTPISGTPSEVPSGQPVTKSAGNLDSITKKADPGVDTSKFNPELQRRVELMATAFKQETGKMLLVTSGYRSNEKQKELYDADLAKNNGKPSGKVAQPMAPLGSGKGSVHMQGLGIDINSKGPGGLNELAGSRDKPTGWLEKFGLIRNVKGEDWHITIAGAPSTPDDAEVPDKKGNAVDVETGKVIQGSNIGKSSNEIAVEQRNQSKPKNPTVVNAGVTNNTTIIREEKILPATA